MTVEGFAYICCCRRGVQGAVEIAEKFLAHFSIVSSIAKTNLEIGQILQNWNKKEKTDLFVVISLQNQPKLAKTLVYFVFRVIKDQWGRGFS